MRRLIPCENLPHAPRRSSPRRSPRSFAASSTRLHCDVRYTPRAPRPKVRTVKLTQRKRTNADRTHLLGVLGSVLLATIAVVSIAVGALAWSQPRTDVVRLSPGVPASLTPSPLFDPGSTVFAQGEDEDPADPASWGCVLLRDGTEVSLQVRPDFDAVGSRVLEGEPYVPVVAVGTTVEGDRLRCDPATADTGGVADHAHRRNRRETDDAVRAMLLDRVDVDRGDAGGDADRRRRPSRAAGLRRRGHRSAGHRRAAPPERSRHPALRILTARLSRRCRARSLP